MKAFLPVIMKELWIRRISGICDADNRASRRVMEKCGFGLEYEGPGDYQGEQKAICRYTYTQQDVHGPEAE